MKYKNNSKTLIESFPFKYYMGLLFVVAFTGDGGNDVSMIQAANVGIGIVGKVCTGLFYLVNGTV